VPLFSHKANKAQDRSVAGNVSSPDPSLPSFLDNRKSIATQRKIGSLVKVNTRASFPSTAIIQRKLAFKVGLLSGNILDKMRDYIAEVNGPQHPDDPKIKFNKLPPSIEVDYTAQQLQDQYPKFFSHLNRLRVINLDNLTATLNHKSGLPIVIDQVYGIGNTKQDSILREEKHKELVSKIAKTSNEFDYSGTDDGITNRSSQRNYKALLEEIPAANEDIITTLTKKDGAMSLLEQEEGLVVGEEHSKEENRKFVLNNLDKLKKEGVNTIYLEAIRSDYQTLVNEYLQPENDEMPPELLRFLKAKETEGIGYLELVQEIKKTGGIRVVGIDAPEATSRPYESLNDREIAREAAMNLVAAETINKTDKENRNGGKYIVLTGRAHSNTQKFRENNLGFKRGIPGLSQMLDVPAIYVPDGQHRPMLDTEAPSNRGQLPPQPNIPARENDLPPQVQIDIMDPSRSFDDILTDLLN